LLSGDTINFFVARKFGPRILARRPLRWILNPDQVRQAETFLSRKGSGFLFCIRFLPLVRTVLFFTAGSLQVRPRTFYLLNGTATVIYLTALMNLAYSAGKNTDVWISTFKHVQFILLGLLILIPSLIFIRKKFRRSLII
jgi:membrane protein DedA with SNARE-associated domain